MVMQTEKIEPRELELPLSEERSKWLMGTIRDVPDFPKEGIMFKDITTLLKDPVALTFTIDALTEKCRALKPDAIVGIESRGFILAPAIARNLGIGFVPVRKPGKLPAKTARLEYELEYGTDALEVHLDAVEPGERVVVIDDLLATGGTAKAAHDLLKDLKAKVVGLGFIIELDFLDGRKKLEQSEEALEIFSLLHVN